MFWFPVKMILSAAFVLHSLKDQWQQTPPSWDTSNDPCDSKWEGIVCNDYRVTEL